MPSDRHKSVRIHEEGRITSPLSYKKGTVLPDSPGIQPDNKSADHIQGHIGIFFPISFFPYFFPFRLLRRCQRQQQYLYFFTVVCLIAAQQLYQSRDSCNIQQFQPIGMAPQT